MLSSSKVEEASQNSVVFKLADRHDSTQHHSTPHYTTLHELHYTDCTTPQQQQQQQLQLQLRLQLHYNNYTTRQLQFHYTTATTTSALHHTTSSRPLQPLRHCNHSPPQKIQLQSPFGPSADSLCHPCITTTHLSYSVLSLKLPPPPCAVLLG